MVNSVSHRQVTPTPPVEFQAKRGGTRSGLLRVLLIGKELRIEALRSLLSFQEDMRVLSPISDLDHVMDAVFRMNIEQSIDVIVIDWDGLYQMNTHLLQILSAKHQKCLVIGTLISPGEVKQLEEFGAQGYCFTGASPVQLASCIRTVAGGRRVFLIPAPAMVPPHDLKVKRSPVFYRERLEARAAEIGWELRELDISIIAHFDSDSIVSIAEKIDRRPGTVRTDLSNRIFLFLQLLSGRKRIPSQKIGFQVLLEFGIFEYR
jgi:DNA-binding NarL/FixJ family response regulator